MFGSNQALAGINLTVAQGNIHALLGPNGSGKTTVVRVLTTLLKPTAGRIKVLGYDVSSSPAEVRARIALTGQFASQDEDLTGSENLRLVARLYGFRGKAARQRARVLLEAFDLSDAANRQVKHYSGGMRRRLDIAGSLVVPPEILFLDEPTTGLDPRSRGAVWDVVRSMAAMGTTILLTTQYLEEADQLADRITVIDRGRMVAEGTSSELKARTGSRVLKVALADSTRLEDAQAVFAQVIGADALSTGDSTTLKFTLKDPTMASRILEELTKRGIEPQEFSMSGPTLDEAFLELTKSPDAGQEVSS
jgi:ABC-2 type transport system ATP-binding protein